MGTVAAVVNLIVNVVMGLPFTIIGILPVSEKCQCGFGVV